MGAYDNLSIKGTKHWKEKPDKCPYCGSPEIEGVEILGALEDDPLLWECQFCKEYLLRFTKRTTKKYLDRAQSLAIDPKDWDEVWAGLPN